jgi:hypothetical protein
MGKEHTHRFGASRQTINNFHKTRRLDVVGYSAINFTRQFPEEAMQMIKEGNFHFGQSSTPRKSK